MCALGLPFPPLLCHENKLDWPADRTQETLEENQVALATATPSEADHRHLAKPVNIRQPSSQPVDSSAKYMVDDLSPY